MFKKILIAVAAIAALTAAQYSAAEKASSIAGEHLNNRAAQIAAAIGDY